MNFGRSGLAAITGMLLLLLTGVWPATASTVLYQDFDTGTTSNWELALAGRPDLTVITAANADAAFSAQLGSADLAIVQFDQFAHSAGLRTDLLAYIAAGGRVIFSSQLDPQYDDVFGVMQTGANGGSDFASLIIDDLALAAGLSTPLLTVFNAPLLGTFWRSFGLTDPTAMGLATILDEFGVDLGLGIVLGNGGKTIINGFAGSTIYGNGGFSDPSDEIQLYKNEVNYLIPSAVPEPATGALLGLGLLVTAALGYRRSK